jgi:hypothetical protein
MTLTNSLNTALYADLRRKGGPGSGNPGKPRDRHGR